MRKLIIIIGTTLLALPAMAQLPKITTTKSGLLIGIQRGKYNGIELGYERQWKQVKLVKPKTLGFSATGEFLLGANAFGFKAGPWAKFGRTNFTYGLNAMAAFKANEPAIGLSPAIGIKLLGFHGQVSYNLIENGDRFNYNKFNISVRYFLIKDRKFHKKKHVRAPAATKYL